MPEVSGKCKGALGLGAGGAGRLGSSLGPSPLSVRESGPGLTCRSMCSSSVVSSIFRALASVSRLIGKSLGSGTRKVPLIRAAITQPSCTAEVTAATSRLAAEGLATATEEDIACCYSVQDKVWVTGPGDEPWEVYVVKGDADVLDKPADSACCAPAPVATTVCPLIRTRT